MVEFENTNNRTETTKWYSITGAPAMKYDTPRGEKSLMPSVAKFVFVDGDVTTLSLRGKVVRQDGSVSEQTQQMPNIYIWNQQEWPDWLNDLYKLAYSDFATYRSG